MTTTRAQLGHLLGGPDALLDTAAGPAPIDQLAPIVRAAIIENNVSDLVEALQEAEAAKEADIRAIADSADNPFREVVDYLDDIYHRADQVEEVVRLISSQMQRTGHELTDTCRALDSIKRTRHNLDTTLETIRVCLEALEHTNQVRQLLKTDHKVAAVHSLIELQTMGLDRVRHVGLTNMLSRAIPRLRQLVIKSTFDDLDIFLNTLYTRVTETGARAFDLLREQRENWAKIIKERPHLAAFRFNSPVEIAYREAGPNFLCDSCVNLDLRPLYEAELVFSKLDRTPELAAQLDRRMSGFASALVPRDTTTANENMIKAIVGFCVTDRILSRQVPNIRGAKQVSDTYEQLTQELGSVISNEIQTLKRTADFEPYKELLSLMLETLGNFGFNVGSVAAFLGELLSHFSRHLVDSNKRSFLKTWESADHMSMAVNKPELYDSVLKLIWAPEDVMAQFSADSEFPRVLPFSEIYPLMCADLRSLVSKHTSYFDQFQHDPTLVEDKVRVAVDEYLTDVVCAKMVESLQTTKRDQLMQTLVDLQYCCAACSEIEVLLESLRMSGRKGHIVLRATEAFTAAYQLAENRVYEHMNSVVDEFVDLADYDWHTETKAPEQSTYALELATFFMTMVNSALVRLPQDLRAFVYLAAADRLCSDLIELLLQAPNSITEVALENFDFDLQFLESFIIELSNTTETPSLKVSLLEVRQMVNLLKSADPTEYNNPRIRLKKYDRISSTHVPRLVGKLKSHGTPVSSPRTPQSSFMKYLSGDKT